MKDIVYIPEVKEFIVDGKTIKESELTSEEIKNFKNQAKIQPILFGSEESNQSEQIIV
jgi:phosphopantetheinyl transferase (holo-ACP synthase)